MSRQRFVVIVEGLPWEQPHRAFGPYRTFRRAEGDARAWAGFVLPLESQEAGMAVVQRIEEENKDRAA